MRKTIIFLLMSLLATVMLTGCKGSPVQKCVIDNVSYSEQSTMDEALQKDSINLEEAIEASIEFIESPVGTEYEVKWYLEDEMIYSETKAIDQDKHDILVYTLEADTLTEGTLKLEVVYKDKVIFTKKVKLQNGEK